MHDLSDLDYVGFSNHWNETLCRMWVSDERFRDEPFLTFKTPLQIEQHRKTLTSLISSSQYMSGVEDRTCALRRNFKQLRTSEPSEPQTQDEPQP